MHKFIFVFLCSILPFSLTAQNNPEVSKSIFSVNFLIPSVELETRISEKTTLDLSGGIGFGLSAGTMEDGTEIGLFPVFSTQYRYYYNLEKRARKSKKVSQNSGNYVAAAGEIMGGKPIFGDLEYLNDYSALVGAVWGLQRYYNSGFKLDLNLGAGYGFNDLGDSYISPVVGLKLGWLISNKD